MAMKSQVTQIFKKNHGVVLTTLIVTLLLGLMRASGSLQFLELSALDFLFVHHSTKNQNSKIVVVKILESDLQNLQEYPLSDRTLAEILTRINQQQPRVIGLNIFRDFPVPSSKLNKEQNLLAYQDLLKIFKNTNNLLGIEKVTHDIFYSDIRPPTILKDLDRITSADIIVDPDGIVRRGILFPVTDGSEASTIPSMGLALALNYLADQNINPTLNRDGWLKLQNKVFLPFQANDGGYIAADDRGYQILLNWRGEKNYFPEVSISDILNDNFDPNLFRDRIVLIGTTAVSVNDVFYVPHLQDNLNTPIGLYGVEIQAHLASYIIDSVLNNRPLIKTFSDPWEYLWLTSNIFIIAFWGWSLCKSQNPGKLLLIISIGTLAYSFLISGIVYLVFRLGWWLPIVPTIIGILAAAITIKTCIYIDKLNQAKVTLEHKVAERTKELKLKNSLLKSTLEELKQTQTQLIAKEKLATLGRISAGIAHEIRNPLNLINLNTQLIAQYNQQLIKKLKDNKCFFEELIEELFEDNNDLFWLGEKIELIQKQVKRGEQTIQDVLSHTPSGNLNFSSVNIKNFIQETITVLKQDLFRNTSDFRRIFKINIEREELQIELITNDFRRVLVNILENSCDSLQEKKELQPNFEPSIEITIEEETDSVKILIKDNGMGIAQDELENIFLPFYTQKLSGKGTGLGLFFAREIIVGEHQGTIDVETQLEEYCQFTICLPKDREKSII